MSLSHPLIQLAAGAAAALALLGLFRLYQSPLLQIYLTSWGIC